MLLPFYSAWCFDNVSFHCARLHPRRGGKKKTGTKVPEQENRDSLRAYPRRLVRRGIQVSQLWVVHSRMGTSPLRAPAENSSPNVFNLIETTICFSD